jgi:hypothetical protein
MSHFINIEYNCKAKIQSEVVQKIELVDSLSQVYKKRAKDDIQNFESELKTKLDSLKINPNDIALRNKLSSKPYIVDATTLRDIGYSNPEDVTSAKVAPIQLKINRNNAYLDTTLSLNNNKYLSVFANWTRLSLVATYAKLNGYVEENINMINAKLKELPIDNKPVIVSYNNEQLPLNNPSKLNEVFPPNYTLPMIVVVITHLFLLLPFFYHKVRGYGSKTNRNDISENLQRPGTIEI